MTSENPSPPRRRRPRYRGTHPRRFDERYKELQPEKYPAMQRHIRSRGRTPAGTHVPVLIREVISCLRPAPGETAADCTLGYGGHAAELIKRLAPGGRLIGFDVDGPQLERTRRRLAPLAAEADVTLSLRRMNFAGLAGVLAQETSSAGPAGLDIILADLGVSSMQVDDPARGISYKNEGPLDMRMDDRLRRTGADLLATMKEDDLSRALWELSDEPDHARIAAFVVQQRQAQPIATTGQLTRLVFAAKGTTEKAWRKQAEYKDLHPAARTFQAMRILVNDELGSLRELLRVAPLCLGPGGRIGIISFHSGEDRLVKNALRDGYRAGVWSATSPQPICPSPLETRDNPRSASAKFRWALRAAEPRPEPR
jgi:16S rRNA (cytosine1402-N4)-methyltransferase